MNSFCVVDPTGGSLRQWQVKVFCSFDSDVLGSGYSNRPRLILIKCVGVQLGSPVNNLNVKKKRQLDDRKVNTLSI